ncbi:MAG: PspC domain-containing protein, partial [Muribaculaceae bacterium]|nr:PspC domain-containing protein [Muribaculaceae bacterium]
IVGDIESRIRELVNEKASGGGSSVIGLADVEKVIEPMGRPEDISGESENHSTQTASQPDENEPQPRQTAAPKPFITFNLPSRKKLYRNMKDKVFGGVFGGLAVYLGWNANIMRILFLVLVLSTKVIPFTIVYLIAWMVIPAAITPRQVLQMRGIPVNVDTVGKEVMADSPSAVPPSIEGGNFFSSLFSVLGKCVLCIVGFVAGVASFGCITAFLSLLAGAMGLLIAHSSVIVDAFMPLNCGWPAIGLALAGSMFGAIVFGAITWGCASVLFSLPKASKSWTVSLFITSIMLAAVAAVLFMVMVM